MFSVRSSGSYLHKQDTGTPTIMKLVNVIRALPRAAIGGFLAGWVVAIAGIANPSSAADPTQAAPIPAGLGRLWFLRSLEPGTAMNSPMLYANGTPIAESSEGTAFYHDLPPGTYVIAVDSCKPGAQSTVTVPLDAGNDFALQVQQDDFGPLFCGPTFYLSIPSAEIVSSVFAPLENLGQR
jgi:hypothetical protein